MDAVKTPHRVVPLSESPVAKMMAERRHADIDRREKATPPIVPRADPPTQMSEVPPGIAPIRAIPTRRPGVGQPSHLPMDTVGEKQLPVDAEVLNPDGDPAST